jgi:hypothetical protein
MKDMVLRKIFGHGGGGGCGGVEVKGYKRKVKNGKVHGL